MKRLRILTAISVTVASLALASPATATVNRTSIWAPCQSSEPGPAYGVIVKGVYGTCVHYTAQVFQFDSVTGKKAMLVEITNEGFGVWDDLVYVNLASASLGSRIYEDNIVYFAGRLDGTYSYTTSLGGTNTVPQIDVTQLRLATSNPKPTTPATVKPKTTPATTKAASPAIYLLGKSQLPNGWTKKSLSGTGLSGMLSDLCPMKDRVTATCSVAAEGWAAKRSDPVLLEGLIDYTGAGIAQTYWEKVVVPHDYGRATLGHSGSSSRSWVDSEGGRTTYLTVIRKGSRVAVVVYGNVPGPNVAVEASYWDSFVSSLVPPKNEAPKPPTTTTTTTSATTTTRPSTTTTARSTTTTTSSTTTAASSTTCAGPCKFSFPEPDENGFVSVQLNSVTENVACPDPGACDATGAQQVVDVNVTLCAGPGGVNDGSGDIDNFALALSNGTQASQDSVTFDSNVPTAFGAYGALAGGQCLTGDMYYDAPSGVNWTSLNFAYTSSDLSTQQVYVWKA